MMPTDVPASTAELVRLEAVVRPEVLDRVVHALRDGGALRLTVMHAHAIGAGADPETAKLSMLEGSAFAEVAVVQVVCPAALAPRLTDAIVGVARTGRRGDGIVVESSVRSVVKIRTGAVGPEALA
jgi:nitrogen regulatory protein P-II 1